MLYIDRVKLENFRCFKDVELEADTSATTAPWTLLTGDNASGKTTLLKAIALGLCDRSSAAGLLRESDSGYIREQQDSSKIEIDLVRTKGDNTSCRYTITTRLTQLSKNLERLDQETDPPDGFPWGEIFVCGYGAGRGTSGAGDIAGYTAISAVYNLFNYSEGLQNPELTIRRLQNISNKQNSILQTAHEILSLSNIRLADGTSTDAGILVEDPRGLDIALRDLADGYKSTFLWLTDFLGWALARQREDEEGVEGIIVIDEIEQHLHPRWQKSIIGTLRKVWPRVQFFASTHAPLVARSFRPIGDSGPHQHYHLKSSEGDDQRHVEAIEIPAMGGQRTDQVLASPAFDYLVDDDPDAVDILNNLSDLIGNARLTADQQRRAEFLRDEVQAIEDIRQIVAIKRGQTQIERSAAEWADRTQAVLIEVLEEKYMGYNIDTD